MTAAAAERTADKGYTGLTAWQKAYALVMDIYGLTRRFPQAERFGLASQLQRAAISIPCNIAEGWGRGSTTDYLRFVQIARGSANEVQTQLWLGRDLDYIAEDDAVYEKIDEVQRLLTGLVRALVDKQAEHTR